LAGCSSYLNIGLAQIRVYVGSSKKFQSYSKLSEDVTNWLALIFSLVYVPFFHKFQDLIFLKRGHGFMQNFKFQSFLTVCFSEEVSKFMLSTQIFKIPCKDNFPPGVTVYISSKSLVKSHTLYYEKATGENIMSAINPQQTGMAYTQLRDTYAGLQQALQQNVGAGNITQQELSFMSPPPGTQGPDFMALLENLAQSGGGLDEGEVQGLSTQLNNMSNIIYAFSTNA
jgi:hypothetical protein